MNEHTVLVPVSESSPPALLTLAAALAGTGGRVVALSVVELPLGRQPIAGAATARAARHALRRMLALADADGVELQARTRVARRWSVGVREVADEERPDLLLLPYDPASGVGETGRDLILSPPCDTVVVRLDRLAEVRSVLVAARGGPTSEFSLRLGERVAARFRAQLTLLHLDFPGASMGERVQEQRLFSALLRRSAYPRLKTVSLPATELTEALRTEATRHQVLVLGASALVSPERAGSLGDGPEALLARGPAVVMVAKPRQAADPALFRPRLPLDAVVEKWFAENTFHSREFSDLEELVRLKQAQAITISVVLAPTGDVDTLPAFARVVRDELSERAGLVDEIVVLDDGTAPGLADAAASLGLTMAPVAHAEAHGRGRLLWEALRLSSGGITLVLDTDIRNIHPRFIYGLAGPLLREPRVVLTLGFQPPPDAGVEDIPSEAPAHAGESAFRPLLNLYFPELSGLVSPLSHELALRRDALTGIVLPARAGADAALLLHIYEHDGLWAVAQSDLEERLGRPADVAGAARSAFAAVQALMARVAPPQMRPAHAALKLIRRDGERYYIEVVDAAEPPLPPLPPRAVLAAPTRSSR